MKRGNTYSVRYNYKDHAGKPCKGWETFKTKAEAQERKITVEKELLDGTFLVPDTIDVYKRQVLYGVNVKHTVVVAQGGEDAPVSYTHLDVYKRQSMVRVNSGSKTKADIRLDLPAPFSP